MKRKLTAEEKQWLHEAISEVMATGTPLKDEARHLPVMALVAACEEMGLTKHEFESDDGRDGFSSNGWQWDWWQRFKSQDGRLWCLSGSGYYGGICFDFADEC